MTLLKYDAQAEARILCRQIDGIENANADWEHRSDGAGNKYLVITAIIHYKEEEE